MCKHKIMLLDKGYDQNTQINKALAMTAASVKGNPTLMKSRELIFTSFFFNKPTPTIFAAAPIGVILPPMVVPIIVPKSKRYRGKPCSFANVVTTPTIAAK